VSENEENAREDIPEDHQLIEEEPTAENLQAELENLQAQLAEANDKLLRARADTENIRKRGILDVENAHKYGVERFARELLQVVDSLEKGLEAASATDAEHVASMQEGMHLTHKLLMSVLDKFNIKQVDPLGHDFDPKLHEALTMQPTTEMEPNKVLTVAQKGFVIHDRVLRPARVVVAKAPE
jgi:molecular chaperone GrpE